MITNDGRCTHKIKSRTATAKAAFNKRKIFSQANCLKLKEETSEMLQLEHSFVLFWNLDTAESRTETPWNFWHVLMEKDEEDQVDWKCEKLSITKSHRGKEYALYNTKE